MATPANPQSCVNSFANRAGRRTLICGSFLAAVVAGCSAQSFDYLTNGSGAVGGSSALGGAPGGEIGQGGKSTGGSITQIGGGGVANDSQGGSGAIGGDELAGGTQGTSTSNGGAGLSAGTQGGTLSNGGAGVSGGTQGGSSAGLGGGPKGGSTASGGVGLGGNAQGGMSATGGIAKGGNSTGGSVTNGGAGLGGGALGGTVATGGVVANGGSAQGGTTANTSTLVTGGSAATGGSAQGGVNATGGTITSAGTSSTSPSIQGPCDIYQAGSTPCVAAHSMVRALYGAYNGNLYQVRRASDSTTKNVAVLGPGGYANSATQDTFCSGTTCTISIIYDQSSKGNHLKVTLKGGALTVDGTEANATAAKTTANGSTVYGVYTTGSGVGYRNNATQGMATGDQPEALYMVASGQHYNASCCFDYGNAETTLQPGSAGMMEAIYFGSSTTWGKGNGSGPWVMGDLELGLFAGQSTAVNASNTPLTAAFVTAMVKGDTANHFAIKGGSALAGNLTTMYDGQRPTGYNPMKKQGAIVLGVGGNNNYTGQGTFFEGCIVTGYPSDATDNAVQANIVAAKFGG